MNDTPAAKRLVGKVALISGGAKGMGAEHARAIVRQGGKVAIGDILQDEGKALVESLGPDAIFVTLDVTKSSDWEAAVAETVMTFGALNVLINNAGIVNGGPVETYSMDDWVRILDVNLTGAFRGVKAAITELKRSSPSSIINVSSTAGLKGFAFGTGYGASKFGLRGMTKCLAIELAGQGVRVNSVHPGNVDTDLVKGVYQSLKHVPMQRLGKVGEVTDLIVFLASDESSFSTGAEFIVDGGETAGMPLQIDLDAVDRKD